ncbi:MAG: transposase domain-containing protein [Hyphomicrobiales bacterium]|nr:transposase domain-containing protein [Hyphomicrobiales bacterium]
MGTARLNGIDPQAWFTDELLRSPSKPDFNPYPPDDLTDLA